MTKGEEPAFGFGFTTADGQHHVLENGLTKREYFAVMALQGLLSRGSNPVQLLVSEVGRIAEEATIMADTLINELNKTP